VDAFLRSEVDELRGATGTANGGFDDTGGGAGDGDDGTVVVGVERIVEQAHALYVHSGDDGLDDVGASAFREVGNAFDERVGHG
jgi:hypothetical protein